MKKKKNSVLQKKNVNQYRVFVSVLDESQERDKKEKQAKKIKE